MKEKEYNLKLTYFDGTVEMLTIKTKDLEWAMDQYQRNRDGFKWEIIEDADKDN
jgi:hypothetical protein